MKNDERRGSLTLDEIRSHPVSLVLTVPGLPARDPNGLDGLSAEYVWHKETTLAGFDAIVLPGGFAYGDYLRCGAIARFSPIMNEVVRAAKEGQLILGTCNGFRALCEAGLLPGALVRNRGLRFVCDMVNLRIEVADSSFTHDCAQGTILRDADCSRRRLLFCRSENITGIESERADHDALLAMRPARPHPNRIQTVPLKTLPAFVIGREMFSV